MNNAAKEHRGANVSSPFDFFGPSVYLLRSRVAGQMKSQFLGILGMSILFSGKARAVDITTSSEKSPFLPASMPALIVLVFSDVLVFSRKHAI